MLSSMKTVRPCSTNSPAPIWLFGWVGYSVRYSASSVHWLLVKGGTLFHPSSQSFWVFYSPSLWLQPTSRCFTSHTPHRWSLVTVVIYLSYWLDHSSHESLLSMTSNCPNINSSLRCSLRWGLFCSMLRKLLVEIRLINMRILRNGKGMFCCLFRWLLMLSFVIRKLTVSQCSSHLQIICLLRLTFMPFY